MQNWLVAAIAAAGLAGSGITAAQSYVGRLGWVDAPAVTPDQTIIYGNDPLQKLDFRHARTKAGAAPLIVFVHGGGWSRGSKDNATGRWMALHLVDAWLKRLFRQ